MAHLLAPTFLPVAPAYLSRPSSFPAAKSSRSIIRMRGLQPLHFRRAVEISIATMGRMTKYVEPYWKYIYAFGKMMAFYWAFRELGQELSKRFQNKPPISPPNEEE